MTLSAFSLSLGCQAWLPVLPAAAQAQSLRLPVELRASTNHISYVEDGQIARDLGMPIYQWYPATNTPRGVVLAIHGLALHGHSYDRLARALAEQGYVVVSTDLRGMGRYIRGGTHAYCLEDDPKCKVNYSRSFADLERLSCTLKKTYPNLPLFALGESLGGALAIRLAADQKNLIAGLILSAPALKRHSLIDSSTLTNAGLVMANPRAQLDLLPFVRRYSSDDPQVVEELVSDPFLRRHLSVFELLQSNQTVRHTLSYISQIPQDTPVLVIQGSADRILKANAVVLLLARLRSQDQTVKWFSQRGHILLETQHVRPETVDTVVGWINGHTPGTVAQTASAADEDSASRLGAASND